VARAAVAPRDGACAQEAAATAASPFFATVTISGGLATAATL
jgi:hypothetical protein